MSVSEMKLKHPELEHMDFHLMVLDTAPIKLTALSGTLFYAGLETANRICDCNSGNFSAEAALSGRGAATIVRYRARAR